MMKKSVRRAMHAAACIAFPLCLISYAASDDITITHSGKASMETGQIKHGYFKPTQSSIYIYPIQHVWQQNARILFGYDVTANNGFQMKLAGGGLVAFSTPQMSDLPVTLQTHHFFYVDKAYCAYPVGDPEHLFFDFQLGYFPYKYNPDVRNLGEYLFRTMAYPLVVYSEFDNPQTTMLGARINFQYANKLIENDLLFHSELIGVPVQDWSVSDIVSSTIGGILTVGAGVSLSHYFSVYQGKYADKWADPYYFPSNLDSAAKSYFQVKNGTDTAYLDWRSERLMGRISFDPKPLLQLDFFGKNDLKLYGEVDVIGLKNYPYRVDDVGYDSLKERIFYTFGFNFPGFKYVDLINLEAEYCANRSAFSDENIYGGTLPSLFPVSLSQLQPGVRRAVWRWSVYVKKSFFNDHFSIIGQAARDHKKINFYYFDKRYMSFIEALPTVKDSWWVVKTEFKF